MIRHHLIPEQCLEEYDIGQSRLPEREYMDEIDGLVHADSDSRSVLKASIEIQPININEEENGYLMEFLNALTDTASLDLRANVSESVPSGLPIAD